MTALPEQMRDLAERLAKAIQATVPAKFRGVLRATVDNGLCQAHDVTVEYRPPQPRQGDKRE